jgi:hypothetical protein
MVRVTNVRYSLALIEESPHEAKLGLQWLIVGPVVSEKRSVVSAVEEHALGGRALSQVLIALLAGPGEEVTAGLQGRRPRPREEVVVAVLQLELHLSLLLQAGQVVVEGGVLKE